MVGRNTKNSFTHAALVLTPEFRAYLSSTAFISLAFAMQQLLISWLLVGVLLLPADRVGVLQAFMGIPGIFLMLWGGASADRADPRNLLMRVYFLAPVLPLFLIAVVQTSELSVWPVVIWGLGMSVVMSFSTPAQQAILNRVTAGSDIQKGVSAATAIGFLVQIIGLYAAGQLDRFGLTNVLFAQGICLLLGALMIRRLAPQAQTADQNHQAGNSAIANIKAGLQATLRHRVIFHLLSINFVSTIFNAGAFMTVFPFIIKRVYDGDAALLAIMMAVFFAGAMASNLLMLKLMPFRQPGRLFLLMQLSRIVVLWLMWIEPAWWLLVLATIGWGMNMGFTSTLSRTITQESAEPEYRGRIMGVLALGTMGSAPIGAIVLGYVIESFGTLQALLPAMVLSLILFCYGVWRTEIWGYRSPVTAPAG